MAVTIKHPLRVTDEEDAAVSVLLVCISRQLAAEDELTRGRAKEGVARAIALVGQYSAVERQRRPLYSRAKP